MKRPSAVALVVLAIVILLGGLAGLAFYALLRLQPRTEIPSPAVLFVDLDGLVVERASEDLFLAEVEGASHELLDLALALDHAAEDDRVAGVYLRIRSPQMGWAKAEELRRRLLAFRESGKFVYAYTPFTDELGYYVALAADRIYVLPNAGLELNGFRVEAPFLRGLLEKVGKKERVGDEEVIATVGEEKITYGEVKRILQAIVAGSHGSEDLTRNTVAIERVLERELTKRALLGHAKKQGIEGSKWLAEVRKETERILLINILAEREILKAVVVTEKEIEATYKEHAEMFVRDGKKIPLSQIKGQIREYVATNMKRKAIELYIEGLKRKARITVNEAVLAKV
jgi:hypothetical protein